MNVEAHIDSYCIDCDQSPPWKIDLESWKHDENTEDDF